MVVASPLEDVEAASQFDQDPKTVWKKLKRLLTHLPQPATIEQMWMYLLKQKPKHIQTHLLSKYT